jgi:chemotaxis protein CheD
VDDQTALTWRESQDAQGAAEPRAELYLRPGEMVVAHRPTAVKTILGSCISVCLWDSKLRIGGINHFLLPHGSSSSHQPGRFGSFAVPRLIEELLALGATTATLRAKVFGGAAMITGTLPPPTQIGTQNLKLANELLARAHIAIVAGDTGGGRGRKIVFHTDDGSVSLWEL